MGTAQPGPFDSIMKSFALSIAFFLSTSVFGALPGVTEFSTSPEKVTDAELSALLHARVASADVIAIGESVHGSSEFLRIQARLIRYLVVNHGMRLIVWENPALRSLELGRWVSSCTTVRTPAPIDVLYLPTAADLALWDWVCDFNLSHPGDPIVFRGMDVWDRPWEHYSKIQSSGIRVGIDPLAPQKHQYFLPCATILDVARDRDYFWTIAARRKVPSRSRLRKMSCRFDHCTQYRKTIGHGKKEEKRSGFR